jgi:hypothetical protein
MRLSAYCIVALVFAAFPIFAQHHSTGAPDKPSVHGMLFFGGVKSPAIYVSHLPIFHTPHDYQVLAEIEIPDDVRSAYQKSLKVNPRQTVYTLVPEVFVLPEMLASPRPFKADLYAGHFERGGKPISEKFTVSFKRIIYQKKFDPQEKRSETASYIVFGDASAQYAAHCITAKPDFDHVLSLRNVPIRTEVFKTQSYAICTFSQKNIPLRTGNFMAESTVEPTKMLLKVDKSLYLEFDDLQ